MRLMPGPIPLLTTGRAMRFAKIALAALIACLHFIYAAQNVVNAPAAVGVMAYVFSMADHTVHPNAIGPAVTHPQVIWVGFAVIIVLEFAAALLAGVGAAALWAVRSKSAAAFNAAKGYALLGAGLGLVIWFGFFIVIGGGYFQMWQTPAGQGSLNGAFQYGVICAASFIIIAMADTDHQG